MPFRVDAVPILEPEIALVLDNSIVVPDAQSHKIGYLLFDNHRPLIALPNITDFSFSVAEPFGYFNWTFSNTTATIGDETRIINITATLPTGFPDGAFSRELFLIYTTSDLNGTYFNRTMPFNLTVPKYRNYTTTLNNYSGEISVGSNGVIGNFTLKNIGNVDLTLALVANCSYLTTPKNIPLYRMIEQSVAITYDLPKATPPSNEHCIVNLTVDGAPTQVIDYFLNLSDKIAPEIINVSVFDVESTREATFTAQVRENLGVKSVWMTFSDKRINATKIEDTNNYSFAFEPITELQVIDYSIYAEDDNGNIAGKNGTFNIIELNSLRFNKTIVFGKIRYGVTTQEQDFFTIDHDTPVVVSFPYLKYDCGTIKNESITTYQINASWWEKNIWGKSDEIISAKKESIEPLPCSFKIILTDTENNKKFIDSNSTNTTLSYAEKGVYKIAVSGEQTGGLYGTIQFTAIPQHKSVQNQTLFVDFVSYDVPIARLSEDFTWGTRDCKYVDEGAYDTSRTICTEQHFCSRGICDARRLGATMSPEDKQKITNVLNDEILRLKRESNSQSIRLYVLLFAFIATASYVAYQKYVHPYLSE